MICERGSLDIQDVEALRRLQRQREATAWRRYLHENPELDYRLHNTASFVAEKLASFCITTSKQG